MVSPIRFIALSACALALAGCGSKEGADDIDNRIAGKVDADPALMASLEDQIMVDTSLSGQSNDDAIRPAREPAQTPVPVDAPARSATAAGKVEGPTLGTLAAQQGDISRDSFNGCGLSVQYSTRFAAQLPADMDLYPGAKVIEAAGSNDNDCKLRAVSFAAAATPELLVNHYLNAARKAGYTPAVKPDGNGKMVSGRRAADGAAFYVVVQGQGSNATADLVVNNGV